MNKKPSIWQGLLIGSVLTPICLHLKYPFNLWVMLIVIVGLFVYIVKYWEKYNKFHFAGMISAIVGSIVVASSTTGKVIGGSSLEIQLLASLGMLFSGMILIGIGNHIANPEKVPKKTLYLGTAFFCTILGIYWLLFEW